MHIPVQETRNQKPETRNRGVTLIELLVVIAIISVLMSLTAGAVFRVIGLVNHGNTVRTLMKVEGVFEKQISRLREEAELKDPSDFSYFTAPVTALPLPTTAPMTLSGGNYDRERRRGRVILFKYLLKWSFPMTFGEVRENVRINPATGAIYGHPNAVAIYSAIKEQINKDDPTLYNPATGEIRAVNRAFIQDRSAGPDRRPFSFTESAAIMAAIYSQLGKTDELTSVEYQDTDGDGVYELCDAWGTPLRLYRWPTGDLRVERAFDNKAGSDPDDPEACLADAYWTQVDANNGAPPLGSAADQFEKSFHVLNHRLRVPRINPQTNTVHPLFFRPIYAPMVIVSAGPGEKFGLGYARKQTAVANLVPDLSMRIMGEVAAPGYVQADQDAVLQTPPANEIWEDELDNIYSYRLRVAVTGQ